MASPRKPATRKPAARKTPAKPAAKKTAAKTAAVKKPAARKAPAKAVKHPFLTDVKTLRARARKHMEQGAVTEGYAADRTTVIKLLNEALATEIVCVLRYKRHYYMASGLNAQGAAAEFLQHATEEQMHMDELAARIVQLQGEPDFSPQGLHLRSHAEYVAGTDLVSMIREDLVAERVAIDSYREMITYLGTADSTTRRMLEGILAVEEEHADDLVGLLAEMGVK